MTSIYKNKAIKAIELCESLSQLLYVEEKIKTTPQINRRTDEGRKLSEELLELACKKGLELTSKENPF